jgi:TetR/AcrR family transcriptional regulator, transcriptional repressor of bet genes
VPKQVDHQQRRRELADAVWTVIGRRGLDGASIREVAAAAGWSNGALRHYFRTRDDLLRFAFAVVGERTEERYAAVAGQRPRDAIRNVLLAALPLDEDGRLECVIWFVFSSQATVNPELQREWTRVREISLRGQVELIERGQELREIPADLDPRLEAELLSASVDGIALHALAEPAPSTDVTIARLDQALERLFVGVRAVS